MNERRAQRSQDPYRALCLQLEHSRTHGALEAVVVAIDNGLLVAGAGDESLCEALGAVAPLVDESRFEGAMPRALDGQNIDVRTMRLEGEMLYVASAGHRPADVWLQRSINGVRRILGRRLDRN
ncbi:MAG: hypothetical protein OES69_05490 [Myxococcales bacterium]|nr:hypothetical protein [Myxococcales bacterium]MDH3843370.1 hypothetical protein [Myxococcales bacterium]